MSVVAVSPGSITGFFVIFKNGSTGASLNIANGMKTRVSKSDKDFFVLNGKKSFLPVSRKVLELFRVKTGVCDNVRVEHETVFPIGYGLGISGAGALSLSLALNKFFRTKLSKEEVVEIAKQAEIFCGTGLGDVVAEQFCGLLIGKKPYPSRSAWVIRPKERFVVLGFFRPIKTKVIIRSKSWKKKINAVGLYCMEKISKERSLENFMVLSKKFALETGLANKKIGSIIEKLGCASMAMLGETIFIPTNSPRKVKAQLQKFCKRVLIARVALHGAK
ncbi:MAG: hypothetical protein QXD98_01440 [Candidatus Diapherotrites archaeon]